MRALLSLSGRLARDRSATAGVEMALVAPMLIVLMFGSMELGNYFLTQHAVSKQVRDGARFASRLSLATPNVCSAGSADASGVYDDSAASDTIIAVTKTGSVDGTATGRFDDSFWQGCPAAPDPDADPDAPPPAAGEAVTVTMRCVDKDLYSGVYSGITSDIPVVSVNADVAYSSLFNAIGFNASTLCLRATSEVAVAGL